MTDTAPDSTPGAMPAGRHPDDRWAELAGIEYLEVTPDRVRARLDAGSRHQQPMGVLHGGVYCTVVEAVASYGAGWNARARGLVGVLGIANQTDFLRSHSEGELVAEGVPLHAGRSQQLWEVKIRRSSDGALVARGQVRFQVLDRLPAERGEGPRDR